MDMSIQDVPNGLRKQLSKEVLLSHKTTVDVSPGKDLYIINSNIGDEGIRRKVFFQHENVWTQVSPLA